MNEPKDNILPEDFDGVFRFTNWTDEDFVGIWGKKEYRFPAMTRSPMIMPEFSPLEVQSIRKKFAKDLAQQEFFKSAEYNRLDKASRNDDGTPKLNSFKSAFGYTDSELTTFIQKCLEPLPESRAEVSEAVVAATEVEDKLTRNEEGELNTQAVDRKTSLKQKALQA